MVSLIYIAALLSTSLVLVQTGNNETRRVLDEKRSQQACQRFGATPYFDPKLVLGRQWRIYYTWHFKNRYNCFAMKFYETNFAIVGRFYKEMGPYLVEQPMWGAAVLYMTIGAARHQMLLLATFGPAGRVHAVPNLMRDPNFIFQKNRMSVPLIQYQMKLLQGGKYLVMMDCSGGTVSLSTRDSNAPNEAEIKAVAKKLGFGGGALACPPVTTTTTTTTERFDDDKTDTDYSNEPSTQTTKGNKH